MPAVMMGLSPSAASLTSKSAWGMHCCSMTSYATGRGCVRTWRHQSACEAVAFCMVVLHARMEFTQRIVGWAGAAAVFCSVMTDMICGCTEQRRRRHARHRMRTRASTGHTRTTTMRTSAALHDSGGVHGCVRAHPQSAVAPGGSMARREPRL
jgi:hypothetical protein